MKSKGLVIALVIVSSAAIVSSLVLSIGWASTALQNAKNNSSIISSESLPETSSNTESQQTSEPSTTPTSESGSEPTSESSEGGSSESGESIIPLETKYTIIFDLDGGTSPSAEYYKAVNEFSKDDFFYNVTKPGYTFKGWSTNGKKVLDELGNVIKTPFMADMMVFKAIYSASYSITYYLDGGTNNPSNPSTYVTEDTVDLLNPEKEYFSFEGWYDNSSFTGTPITQISSGTTGNINLYARWVFEAPYNNLKYVADGTDVTITGVYDNTVDEIKVPSSFTESGTTYAVKNIAKGAFSDCTSVESMTLPFVGGSAKSNAYLGYVFGDEIRDDAFYYVPTSLKNITISTGIDRIMPYAFRGCSSLESVVLPDSVNTIGSYAFENCYSLTSIEIPSGVTKIDSSAFDNCYSLVEVVNKSSLPIVAGSSYYYGGVAQYAKQVITDESASKLSTDSNGFVTYNDGVDNWLVSYVGNETNVTIPNTVTKINQGAFRDCSTLTSVTIPSGVTDIGDNAFNNCYSLVEVINKSSLSITKGATSNGLVARYAKQVITDESASKLSTDSNGFVTYNDGVDNWLVSYVGGETNIVIPNTITKINHGAFKDRASITSIEIPSSVTSIDYSAFQNCYSLTSIEIPSSVTTIEPGIFANCRSLTSVEIPDSVTTIGYGMVTGCISLTSLVLPNSITTIEYGTFWGCTSLRSIEIPDTVTTIDYYAFQNCYSLTSIEIPSSVTTIQYNAFENCYSLVEVINKSSLSITVVSAKQVITDESESKLSTDSNGFVTYNDGVDNWLVSYVGNETNVTIPNTVTKINKGAFEGCSTLTSVTIPSSVTSIGDRAFENCSSIISIVIPSSVNTIGNCAFRGCCSLTSVTIPSSVTSIGDYAFQNCSSLISIVIPGSVNTIGAYTFNGCWSLISIVIPGSVNTIGSGAFNYCYSLESIFIPCSVTTIGGEVFSDCDSLTINCEAASKPSGWSDYWNYYNRPVNWSVPHP